MINLLQCWKSPHSLSLMNGQEGEAVADFVGSFVLAQQIKKLPLAQQKAALYKSMEANCRFSIDFDASRGDEHPNPLFRLNAIFGGSPYFREILQCKGASTQYATCGLQGRIQG